MDECNLQILYICRQNPSRLWIDKRASVLEGWLDDFLADERRLKSPKAKLAVAAKTMAVESFMTKLCLFGNFDNVR